MAIVPEHNDAVVAVLLAVNTVLTGVVAYIAKGFVRSVREHERDYQRFKTITHSRISVLESRQSPPILNAETV